MNFYRCLFTLVLLFSVASSSFTSRNKFKQGLLKVIGKWKEGRVWSLPFSLPTLPLEVSSMETSIDGYKFEVSERTIEGLEYLEVNELIAWDSTQEVYLDISIQTVSLRADWYRLRKFVWGCTVLDDEGRFSAYVNNLRIYANIQFDSEGVNTVIKHLSFDYSVGSIEVNLSDSWDWVATKLKDYVSKMINDKDEDLVNGLRDMFTRTLNRYLRGRTPAEFINIISSL